MRRAFNCRRFWITAIWLLALAFAGPAYSQTTSFTYQGRLTDGGTAATGSYDLQFALWDSSSSGTQIGSTQTINAVAVSSGVFTVSLDFGANSFPGANRFLEISAQPSGAGSFTLLTPRQPVTSIPYAIRSVNASSADNATTAATATNATQLGGIAASQYVQSNDSRLTDSRPPVPGSANYVQNTSSQQASTNFNISGNGTAAGTLSGNILNATTQFNIAGQRVLSASSFFTAVGVGAGQHQTTGSNDTYVGINAGLAVTTASDNSFFGDAAGFSTTGANNTFVGSGAGEANQAGSNNTAIGVLADISDFNVSSPITNATAIGSCSVAKQSNSLILGSFQGNQGECGGPQDINVGIGTTAPRSALEVKRNWDGSFGALTVTGDRPTIRFSGGAAANNDQWLLHLGAAAGSAPAGSLSFFFGGTAGTSFGSPILSLTPGGTVQVTNLGSAGSTALCRNGSNEISTCSSSLRYKGDVHTFLRGLEIINHLRPISFTWKQDGVKDIGLGAEEVERVEPLLTFRNPKGEIEGVKYNQLSAVFINAIKEQQTEIEQQRALNEAAQRMIKMREAIAERQQVEIDALNARLQSLERRLRTKSNRPRR